MSSRPRRRRRKSVRDESPTASFDRVRRALLWVGVTLVLGMLFLYGGTRFWASAPFLIPLLVVVVLHQGLSLRGTHQRGGRIHPPVALIPGGLLLGYVVLRGVLGSTVPYQTWTEAFQLAVALLLYVVFVDLGSQRRSWSQASVLLFVAGSLQAMLAVALHVKGSNLVLWLERPASYEMRASGTWICPNHFAHFLQMASLVAMSTFFIPKTALHVRLMAGFGLAWMVPALFLSESRSGLLGLVVGGGILLALRLFRKGWKRMLGGVVAGMVALGVGFLSLRFLFTGMYDRLLKTLGGDIRFSKFWPDTWRMIEGEGFWGVGPGVFKHAFEQYRESFDVSSIYLEYAHNEYLHFLADYGWIPVLAVGMAVLFLMVLLLRKVFSADADETAMIPILVLALGGSTLVHAVFDFNLHILANGLVFVMLLGLLEGWGRQKGVWMPPPFPEGIPKIAGRVGLISAALLIPVAAMLGWGGWAEYQLDVARKQGDAQGVATQAEAMRRWVPLHWRGWTEQGLIYRKEAFWIRDPVERSSRIQQSREAYEQAIRRNPYERIALAGLVELAKMEKDYDSALDGLNELQQLAPFDVRIRIQKGLTLQKLERYEESLAVFEEAQRMRRTQDKQIELNLRYLRRKVRSLEDKRRTDA